MTHRLLFLSLLVSVQFFCILSVSAIEEVTGLTVVKSDKTALTFSWNEPESNTEEMAGYKIYFNGTTEGEFLSPDECTFRKTGLSPSTAYVMKIIACDADDNESVGVSATGYTLLENPTGLIAISRPAFVNLSWEASAPEIYVDHYEIYISETDFLTIEGMSPFKTTTDTKMTIGGLQPGTTTFFGVAAVNLSGGRDTAVTTIASPPGPGTVVSGDITQDTTWTRENSPYVVTGDIRVYHTSWSYYSNTAPNRTTLTIEEGVVVRFEPGTGLSIGKKSSSSSLGYHGTLIAQGTADDPVIFTSNADMPLPGDWKGIYFHNATYDAASIMENCIVEYGGSANDSLIFIDRSSPSIRECTIRHSSSSGIRLKSSSTDIDGCTIGDNMLDGITADENSNAFINGNTFNDNRRFPVDIHPNWVSGITNNFGSDNGYNYIRIRAGDITRSQTWTKQSTQSIPFVISGDIVVYHPSWSYYSNKDPNQTTLTLNPGVELRFEPGAGLTIGKKSSNSSLGYHGTISAQGTADDPVIFTSNADMPMPGDWKGIYFHNATYDAASIMENCIVEYGGNSNNANISVNDSSPTIKNCTIRNSSAHGICMDSDAYPIISKNTFSFNGVSAISAHPHNTHLLTNNRGVGDGKDTVMIHGGEVTCNVAWSRQMDGSLPYIVTGDIIVCHPNRSYYSNTNPNQATLTLNPGVELRFESGAGLAIGKKSSNSSLGYHGTLIAQGTIDDPILFTSNTDTPSPGDWKGILFHNATYDAGTFLEHSIVEYGGHTNNANIRIENAKPTIQYNTIRNSSHAGVYATGNSSDGALINCNDLKNNLYGIYTASNAQPVAAGNNFFGNNDHGFYNTHTETVNAEDNWWGDSHGPNINGDSTYGPVITDTWLMEESDCILTPPTNSPPFQPRNPVPVNNAVRVPVLQQGLPAVISLSWDGGDPNPWDLVVYNLYVGVSIEDLALTAENIGDTAYSLAGLSEGTTYFWQVVTRDDTGAETIGPVWSFTTSGNTPDLSVSHIVWEPSEGLIAGQPVLLKATIENSGMGPMVDSCSVTFSVDGTTVRSRTIQPVMAVNQTQEVSTPWVAETGNHILTVAVDSGETVEETDEENNTQSVSLPMVTDDTPPRLSTYTPKNGKHLKEVTTVTFKLVDVHGSVDKNAVALSAALVNAEDQTVAGTTTVDAELFIFSPASLPLPDGDYTFSLRAVDDSGNSENFSFSFTVDTTPPALPTINGVVSPTHNPMQTIHGTKEDFASIYFNESKIIGNTQATDWQYSTPLSVGENHLSFTAIDRAGNNSEAALVTIIYDNIPPETISDLSVNGKGSGTTAILNWSGYDEAAHGDVAGYRIHWQADTRFDDVSSMPVKEEVNAGTFIYAVEGLPKGKEVWFAVVPVDITGNIDPMVNPVSTRLEDVEAPEDVTSLSVHSFDNRLIFSWEASANSAGDLAGYRFYQNGSTQAAMLDTNQLGFEWTGLPSATAHSVKITAVDRQSQPNESSGLFLTGVTWLLNPAEVTAEPFNGRVALTWDPIHPSNLLEYYRVYVLDSNFSDISGMDPVVTTTDNSASVAGLTNGTTYWIAVTAVNISGGERPDVVPIPAMSEADTDGPELFNLVSGGVFFSNGYELTAATTLSISAKDASGVSRVEFYLDGTLLRTDYAVPFTCYLNPADISEGSHRMTIKAFDTLDNVSTVSIDFDVNLALPETPVIDTPTMGTTTHTPEIAVTGQADPGTRVRLYHNDFSANLPVTVDEKGNFSSSLVLSEGENLIDAAAINRAGEGPRSQTVVVTLDTTLPAPPLALAAEPKEGGVIRVSWKKPLETKPVGYHLYRSSSDFFQASQAQRVNANPIKTEAYDDIPPADGAWYYRAVSVDLSNTPSDLSNPATALADSLPPRAASIKYTPTGNHDPDSGAMAQGFVDALLTVTEPLQSTPFLSLTPTGGVPIAIELEKVTDLTYTGVFVLSDDTPNGTAWAVFSARDLVGNRGTEIDVGTTIRIDTSGPSVINVTVTPGAPICNDQQEPVVLTAIVGLSEKVKEGTLPYVGYLLSGNGREAIDADTLVQLDTLPGEAQTWKATFTLPFDAGLTEPEFLSIVYEAVDHLDNQSDRIHVENRFQVYQGDLPPLAAPESLTATPFPDGKIALSWKAVDNAVGYRLYRQGPWESEPTPLVRMDGNTRYEDTTDQDGVYSYAVTSIRLENGQEAESGLSEPVTVLADALAPNAPQNLSLELVAAGIQAKWTAPTDTDSITYRLYRAPAGEITDVTGLSPIAMNIKQTSALDPDPSHEDHCYAVTAVDAAGNESPPSTSFYLNFELLPVNPLFVLQRQNDPPVISWGHGSRSIIGYHLYLGSVQDGLRLNDTLITDPSYTDIGWTGDTRHYTVVAVDTEHVQSPGRSIRLPDIRATLAQETVVRRGLMNRLAYTVENLSDEPLTSLRLNVELTGISHSSEPFSLEARKTRIVDVVVGGYETLIDPCVLTTTIEISPDTNERVEIIREEEISTAAGMPVLQVYNEEFVRNGNGTVWFTLENTGEEEIEIVTARDAGNRNAEDIRFTLLDKDENVIDVQPFRQVMGEHVITLSDQSTVARIALGRIFTSDPVRFDLSPGTPDELTVQLSISDLYYQKGRDTQVRLDGLAVNHSLRLVETSYTAAVDTIEPQTSIGDREIRITGRALSRTTGNALPDVPLALVLSNDGFERSFEVYTDGEGKFSFSYTPDKGASGLFQVRVVHPQITAKPVHGTFRISRISVTPETLALNIPPNYEKQITLTVNADTDIKATDLRLVYDPSDQNGGVLPQGIHLTPGNPIPSLSGGEKISLSFTLWADNNSQQRESVTLRLASNENENWCTIPLDIWISDAKPALFFSPNYVETGMAHGDTTTEAIVLENKGLVSMTGVALSLLSADGSAAPDWAVLNGSRSLGTLELGAPRETSVTMAPGEDVDEGIYHMIVRVISDNYPQTDINLYASVTQSGIGSVLFKVADIYTGTLDPDLQPIQGLGGATITVQNELVVTEEFAGISDAAGEIYLNDLPTGRYKARISADNHQPKIVRFWIKPGITATKDVFLVYNSVTVEWSVKEIGIKDEYEIVLQATYETNVPAPVLVMEPASTTLPDMQVGDVLNGEITLTNFGLVRADDVNFDLPKSDAYFKYDFYGTLPQGLGAMQRVIIPYRVTCLSPLVPDGNGTGAGGCGSYSRRVKADACFECANGDTSTTSSNAHHWNRNWGSADECSGGGSGGLGGGSGSGESRSGGGGSGGLSTEITNCMSDPPQFPSVCGGTCTSCDIKDNDCLQDHCQPVASDVNTLSGRYHDRVKDLTVKVPGGEVRVERALSYAKWTFGHDQRLDETWIPVSLSQSSGGSKGTSFAVSSNGGGYDDGMSLSTWKLHSIQYKGTSFVPSSSMENFYGREISKTYRSETSKITRIGEDANYLQWRWEDRYGNWKLFDHDGLLLEYGNRSGRVARLEWETNRGPYYHWIAGVFDRNGSQVLWYEYNEEGLISAVHDREGRRVAYDVDLYDKHHFKQASVKDVLGNITEYAFERTEGLQPKSLTKLDPRGKQTLIRFDKMGKVKSGGEPDGKSYRFQYDYDEYEGEFYSRSISSTGWVKEVWYDIDGHTKRVDINGKTVKQIEKDGRTLYVTDEKGVVTVKEFDEWGNLTRITFQDGSSRSYTYIPDTGLILEKIDENGIVTQNSYDENHRLVKKVESVGSETARITEYGYDSSGNLIQIHRLADNATLESRTELTYDEFGNISSVTDPTGGVTRFTEYDIMGNVLTKIDPNGETWTYTYDANGNLLTATDPVGSMTELFYDEVGNRIKSMDAEGREVFYEYDTQDNLIRMVDHEGNENLFEYNLDNKLTSIVDTEENKIGFGYDKEGRLTKSIDGHNDNILFDYDNGLDAGCTSCSGSSEGIPTRIVFPTFERSYAFDSRNRVIAEKDHLEGSTTHTTGFAYDNAGNLVSRTDKMGRTIFYVYDGLNRLIKEIDPSGGETDLFYDNRDNLIELTDAEGQTTRFEYDAGNRMIKEVRPNGAETTYGYDAAGNLTDKIDPKNQKTAYRYDPAGRLVEIEYYTNHQDNTPVKTVAFFYDKVGNLTGYDDGITTARYDYDSLSRKTSETVEYGDFSLPNRYSYYGKNLKETFTGPDKITYGYLYDGNNQLAGLQIPDVGMITVSDYRWNRPERILFPGGGKKEIGYDPLMRMEKITSRDPAANPVLNYTYGYDRMNNILSKETDQGNHSFEYDELHRLTEAAHPVSDKESFTYDGVGNRLSSNDTYTEWRYNENNALEGFDTVLYKYDLNGNLVEKNADGIITRLFYNVENRLVRVEDGSGRVIAGYYYDPFGRRLWKEVSGVRTYFHYSDEGLVGEYDDSGTVIKTYGYQPGSIWMTDPIFMKLGGDYYFYHNDHLGTPQKMTASNGAVVWEARYRSFGEATVVEESVTNNLRFAGQYFDAETGLHYNWHRYYDPEIGRYLRQDPIGFEGGINFYSYVQNNPIKLIDPNGEFALIMMGFGAVMGGTSNYLSNRDSLSGLDLAQSIIFGAGLGALGPFIPGGLIAGTVTGSIFAGIGSVHNQILYNRSTCMEIDWSAVTKSMVNGVWGGLLGAFGSKVGGSIVNSQRNLKNALPRNHHYDISGRGLPVSTYGNLGAAMGMTTGALSIF